MLDNEWGMSAYPLVPGHEVVGKVVALGEHTKRLKVGDRVGLGWFSGSCGACAACLAGDRNLCASAEGTIVQRHGGFASRVRAHWSWVSPLPEALDSTKAGPLFCGGITVSIPSSNAACGFGLPRDTSANSPVFVISGCGNAGVSAGASTARALPANPPPSVDAASAEVVRKNARRESGSCSEFGAMARDYEAGTPHLPPRIAPRLTHFAARATARKVKSEFSATEGEKASPGPDGQKQFTASTPTPKARLLAPSA